jgi:hypothetical protein
VSHGKLVAFQLIKQAPLLNGQLITLALKVVFPKAPMLMEAVMDPLPTAIIASHIIHFYHVSL